MYKTQNRSRRTQGVQIDRSNFTLVASAGNNRLSFRSREEEWFTVKPFIKEEYKVTEERPLPEKTRALLAGCKLLIGIHWKDFIIEGPHAYAEKLKRIIKKETK